MYQVNAFYSFKTSGNGSQIRKNITNGTRIQKGLKYCTYALEICADLGFNSVFVDVPWVNCICTHIGLFLTFLFSDFRHDEQKEVISIFFLCFPEFSSIYSI